MTSRIALSLASVLALGCANSVELEVLPEELADAFCETIETCTGEFATVVVASPEGCRQQFGGSFEAGLYGNTQVLIDRGTVTYDGAAAADCLAEAREVGCELLIAPSPPSCRRVMVGNVALGEACAASEECEGDAYCDSVMCPTTTGTCAARKANGASCLSADECQDGLICDDDSCAPSSSRSGGQCEGGTGRSCPLDEQCVGAMADTPGTCTPISTLMTAGLGESCRLPQDGETPIFCTSGLSCAVTGLDGLMPNFECVERVGAGEACNAALPSMCPEGQYCDAQPFMAMFDGTCVTLPSVGQDCAPALAGPRCAAGLVCADDTCVQPQENGASCENDAECYGQCVDGTCGGAPLCPAS